MGVKHGPCVEGGRAGNSIAKTLCPRKPTQQMSERKEGCAQRRAQTSQHQMRLGLDLVSKTLTKHLLPGVMLLALLFLSLLPSAFRVATLFFGV